MNRKKNPNPQMTNTLLGVYTIRQAGRGLVLTIPQKWADEHGVVAGSRVSIESDGDRLVVAREAGPDA